MEEVIDLWITCFICDEEGSRVVSFLILIILLTICVLLLDLDKGRCVLLRKVLICLRYLIALLFKAWFNYLRQWRSPVQALNLLFGKLNMLLNRYIDSEIIILFDDCSRWCRLSEEKGTLFVVLLTLSVQLCTVERIDTCCFMLDIARSLITIDGASNATLV